MGFLVGYTVQVCIGIISPVLRKVADQEIAQLQVEGILTGF